MRLKLIVAAAILAAAGHSQAAQKPQACASDPRVRCVVYDPYEVVEVTGMFGYQTFILFGPDEELRDMGGGDTDAWDIGVIEAKNGIFIKPKSHKPATNITVVTNKRYYNFDFNVAELKDPAKRTYTVLFSYPTEEAKQKQEVVEKDRLEDELKYAAAKKPKNENYWVEGSRELEPTAAWDDGEVTYLRFAPNTPIPAVYMVNEDGTETLVNKTFPERNTMAIQRIARRFVLRRDDLVTCIWNESYNRYGVENETRTISPEVNRVVQKVPDQEQPQEAPPAGLSAPKAPKAAPQSGVKRLQSGSTVPTVDATDAAPKESGRSRLSDGK